MLTQENMKFFIDPLADPFIHTGRVYVIEERTPRNLHLHKVVEVDAKSYRHGNRMWKVTTETGDHVSGPAVNHENLPYSSAAIGLRNGDDSTFFVGTFIGTRNGRAILSGAKRSDQRCLPSLGSGQAATAYEQVDTWFLAAEWALELLPLPTDSPDAVRAKLALAEQRWTQRKAKVYLLSESMLRNYSQLDQLIEDGSMPSPKFGAIFAGHVLVPAGGVPVRENRTVAAQEQIDAIGERLGTTPRSASMMMSVHVETELPLEGVGRTGLDAIRANTVQDAMQTKIGNYELSVANYSLTPILRGAVSGADL